MSNDVDLVSMFGTDYYSIGLFASVSKHDIDPLYENDLESIFNLCYQIKYDYYYTTARIITKEILENFISANSLDVLISLYKPYDELIALHEYHVNDYIEFSNKLLSLSNELKRLSSNTVYSLAEIFNMLNMIHLYRVNARFTKR